MTALVPSQKAMPITATITHQALIRALRLSITGSGVPRLRSLRIQPISEASSRKAPIPPNSIRVCLSMSGRLLSQVQQRCTAALEKLFFAFINIEGQRRAKTGGA
ncbi:hypothetical protein D3C71_1978160 [compost metagenome]